MFPKLLIFLCMRAKPKTAQGYFIYLGDDCPLAAAISHLSVFFFRFHREQQHCLYR